MFGINANRTTVITAIELMKLMLVAKKTQENSAPDHSDDSGKFNNVFRALEVRHPSK